MCDRVRAVSGGLSVFLCVLIFSCNSKSTLSDLIPEQEPLSEWTFFEGRIPLDDKRSLYLEVALMPGQLAGEGSYRLQEATEDENGRYQISDITGNYATHSNEDQQLILQFHHTALNEGLRRSYITNNGKTLREETIRNTDLQVWRKGDRTLIVLDYRQEPITLEPNYNLVKRSSPYFTIEGYFRHTVDSAVFFETNTRERWAVSKMGAYDQATREYHLLVKEKFDSVYLKAVGYSIRQINRKGREVDALVLKRILQTTSPPVIDQENPLVGNN